MLCFSCLFSLALLNVLIAALSSSKRTQISRSRISLPNPGTLPRWQARLHVHQLPPLLVLAHIKELQIILSLHPVGNHLLLRLQE
jgi:hypothetical protein